MDRFSNSRAAVTFVLLASALDALAFGLSIPVLPKLFETFTAGNDARAAILYGEYAAAFALMSFLCAPLLGTLSDAFGRRRVLLVSLAGLTLDYLLMGWAPSIPWLFLGRIISGATAATQPTVNAYVTDITDLDQRPAALGKVEAAWAIGFLAGPALGGVLCAFSLRLPFWVAAGMTCASAIYGYFKMPESLPPAQRAPFKFARAHPIAAFAMLKSNRRLRVPLATRLLAQFASLALPTLFVLYTSFRFHWTVAQVGVAIALSALCAFFVQGIGVRFVTRRLGLTTTIKFALFLDLVAFAGCAFASSGIVFLGAIVLDTVASVFFPINLTLMSETVDKSTQGRLQGVSGSLMGLTNLAGPLLFSAAFRYATSNTIFGYAIPGLAFLVAAASLMVALSLAAIGRKHTPAPVIAPENQSAVSG